MLEIETVTNYLIMQLTINCPVRTNPPSGPYGSSPYPGNLRQNGISQNILNSSQSKITIGGHPAPYGPYTETRSYKKGWINKSVESTIQMIVNRYGGIRK